MAYIYKITNDINQKIYIGKTEFSIEKRFKEHCCDAFRKKNEKRLLYAAMRKYGIEHFYIELIEESEIDYSFHSALSIDESDYKVYNKKAYKYAMKMTEREADQGAESLFHNLNTLQSRSGN